MALRWIDHHPITRIGGNRADEDEDDDYNDSTLDDVDWKAKVRRMSTAQYIKHVKKRYEGLREKGTKKVVVDRILSGDWNTGLNSRQIADLDLAYFSQHATLKSWHVFKLDYGDQGTASRTRVDPLKIERTFSHYLAPYFKHYVQILQEKEVIWIRISIHDGLAPHTLPPSTTIIYFIWFMESEYLLGATIKAEWKDFVLEALLRVFKASGIDERPLTGKIPISLGELLLNKDSQGSYSRYRLNQIDSNPLSSIPQKRKPEDLHQRYAKGMRDIQAEDMDRIAARDRVVATEFGSNPQPCLNRVDLQLNLPYTTKSKDFNLGRLTKQPFPIKVVLEGPNVIEGIKNLVPLGVAKNPMPSFLTELHSMATSSLTVDLDEDDDNKQRISSGY
ncbi:hypothetical protein BGX34_005709 [Mortierella sp. NVP85]|nr:hypothetical protein BGX34_005709 [Mortierella sp. NVP85]